MDEGLQYRQAYYLPLQPPYGCDTGHFRGCGALFGEQDPGASEPGVNPSLCQGESGEEDGGGQPDQGGIRIAMGSDNSHGATGSLQSAILRQTNFIP